MLSTPILAAMWIYQTCFTGLFVECAVLDSRQALQPSMYAERLPKLLLWRFGVMLSILDRSASVTLVTKVVGATSFMNPQTTPSSSASPDQSDNVEVITKVVRAGPTTVNTAKCNPLLCSANVAVSETLSFSMLEQTLILGIVGLRILLASGICENGVSINNL